jgi:hypothetical protein
MKVLRIAMLALLPVLSMTPADSQPASFTRELTLKELIAGKAVPLSVRAKDLSEEFVRFRLTGSSTDDVHRMMIRNMYGMNVADNSIYFTKGDTLKLESGTYLIVYSPENRVDMEAIMRHDTVALQSPRKLRLRDKLLLSLLDLKNVGNISDMRPFDADTDMENEADRNQAVVNTLQKLGAGILGWKHNVGQERLPKWSHLVTQELRQRMYPYVHDRRLWDNPSTGETFRLNAAMSNVRLPDVTNRGEVYLAYEVTPSADGTRGVLFADGRAERVNSERWETLKKVRPAGLTPAETAARQKAMQQARDRQMQQYRAQRMAELKRIEEAERAANPRSKKKTRRR